VLEIKDRKEEDLGEQEKREGAKAGTRENKGKDRLRF
jgi:hypothetical protein